MRRYLSGFLHDFLRAFSALSAEDLGEHLPLREKTAALGIPSDPPATSAGEARQIVLASAARPSACALRHALSACERLDAHLVLLGPTSHKESAATVAKPTVPWHGVTTGPDVLSALADYIDRHSRVLFVVVPSDDAFAGAFAAGRRQRWRPPVPLVLVSDEQPAERAQQTIRSTLRERRK